jgi:hypothetical protein
MKVRCDECKTKPVPVDTDEEYETFIKNHDGHSITFICGERGRNPEREPEK